MSKIATAIQLLRTPGKMVSPLGNMGFFCWLPDRAYLSLIYRGETGEKLNWNNPITFNEKVQWLKVYYRPSNLKIMVDKYLVKDYINGKFGSEHLIPTIGVWNNASAIDFSMLPNQFVLKCTHGSGCNIICKNKDSLDIDNSRKQLNKWMKHSWFDFGREWPYKDVKPRIIAEKYLVDESGTELKDYKFFCFNGIVALIEVDYGRFKEHKRNLYTPDWEYIDGSIKYPSDRNHVIKKPKCLSEMLLFAQKLSIGFPHVRVDLYYDGLNFYFGEMTFYHGSGFEKFTPSDLGEKLGKMITLPEKTTN